MNAYTTRDTCRVCDSSSLKEVFSLGEQYLNGFPTRQEAAKAIRAPLDLVHCPVCSLLQLKHTAPQELLYSRHYWYRSGVTATMRASLREITAEAEERFRLRSGDVVLDVGSNDGTLLRSYQVPGLVRIGVEPATNLAEEGRAGIDSFIGEFWSYDSYLRHEGRKAKVITAIGMFYDMEDPNQFIRDVALVLADEGVFIAQLMCLHSMLEQNDVGNICHEHLEFYSFASLEFLFSRHGLEIFDVKENSVNGGSYRIFARHREAKGAHDPAASRRVDRVRERERELGLGHADSKALFEFRSRIERNKRVCVEFIEGEVKKGKRIWVYGASTKGNVILQYYGLDHRLIEGAADRSPEKHGRFTVGTMIPIFSEEEARRARPDYFLVLPYAFFDEFYEREREWRLSGGRFILPIPEFRVVP